MYVTIIHVTVIVHVTAIVLVTHCSCEVFLSFLTNSRVTTSHQELPKSLLDLALRTHVTGVTYLIVLSVGLVTFAQVG